MPRLLKMVGCEKIKNLYTPKEDWKLMFFNLKEDTGGDFLCIRLLRRKNALLSVANSNLSSQVKLEPTASQSLASDDAMVLAIWLNAKLHV